VYEKWKLINERKERKTNWISQLISLHRAERNDIKKWRWSGKNSLRGDVKHIDGRD
jgi:hypothetical protein